MSRRRCVCKKRHMRSPLSGNRLHINKIQSQFNHVCDREVREALIFQGETVGSCVYFGSASLPSTNVDDKNILHANVQQPPVSDSRTFQNRFCKLVTISMAETGPNKIPIDQATHQPMLSLVMTRNAADASS